MRIDSLVPMSTMEPAFSESFPDLSFAPDDLPPLQWEPELCCWPIPPLNFSPLPSPISSGQGLPAWNSADREQSSVTSQSSFPSSPSSFVYEGGSPFPALPSPKRRRVMGKVKKSHRTVDAARRRREAAVIRRLESLVQTETDDSVGTGKAREKLAVLTASVECIEQLQTMVSTLTAACKAKDESLQDMVERLHDGFSHQLSQQALQSNLFVNGRVPTVIVEVDTGRLLEANESAQPYSRAAYNSRPTSARR
jgi:hypothetical protein